MFQTDQATAATALPAPAVAGTPGFFTNGNPATGVAATILDADFVNMLMMELVNVVAAGGLTPSKTTYTQVRDAIKRLVQNTVVLADTGAVNAYAAANTVPLVAGTWVDGVVQAVKIAHTNTGASTYAPDGLTAIPIYGLGLQPLQGSELLLNSTAIMMHMTVAGVNGGNSIAVLMECAGGAQQVAPAMQSQQAAQLGQTALPLAGQFWNLTATFANAASNTITIDQVIVADAVGGNASTISNWNSTIATNVTGIGGIDTGTVTSLANVAIFAAWNPITGAKGFFGQNVTTAITPVGSVYSGANPPGGYTRTCLVAVVNTDSTGKFIACSLKDRHCTFSVSNQSSGQPPSTNVTLQLGCPINARTVDLYATFTCSVATNANVAISGQSTGNMPVYSNQVVSGQSTGLQLPGFILTTLRTVYWTYSNSTGTPNFIIALNGWSI